MGRRHIFGLVQLNTSCFDFAPTSQKQGGLNDEAEIKQGRKAWSTRSTWGILCFVFAMASEEPVLLHGCSERGINLCCPWQKLCLCLLPSCRCPEQTVVSLVLLGKHRSWGNGMEEALWGLLSQRYHFLSRERGSVSLCAHSHGPILSGWSLRGSRENWAHSHHGHWCWHGLDQAGACQPWQLPGSLISPKQACACLSLLAEVLTLSLLLNFYGHVMNNWIISFWFGKHASPLTIAPGSHVHQDMCPCTLFYLEPYCHLHFQDLSLQTTPSTNNCFCQASYALGSLPFPLSFWGVLGISSPPGLLISSQRSRWQTPHFSYWHQLLSKTSSVKSHCCLCSKQGLFRLPRH